MTLMLRLTLLVLAALVPACAWSPGHAPPASAPPPVSSAPPPASAAPAGAVYTCRGVPDSPEEPLPIVQVPSGRLEIKRLGKPLPAICTSERPCDVEALQSMRVSLVAEAIPLGSLASRLSSELGIGVLTDSALVGVRVSLALPDVSVRELLGVLLSESGVSSVVSGSSLSLITLRRAIQRRRASMEFATLETRLVPVPAGMSPAQVAATWCAGMASSRGVVSVVGHSLVAHDRVESLVLLETLLKGLSESGER